MSRIRSADTKPEMAVRGLVHGMGYRYRLHARDLPGNPDIVFRPKKKVIFVHGCFWHQDGCRHYRMPQTNQSFWKPKLAKNRAHDEKVKRDLAKLRWRAMIVWECQIKNTEALRKNIERFLNPDP